MTTDVFDSKELLQALSEGDEAAFSKIYHRYKDAIYYAAHKMTGSMFTAEEVVQDLFLKLWMHRQKASAITNIKAYLHTMAENLVYDAVRRRQKEMTMLAGNAQLQETISPTPALLLDHKDHQVILQQAIERLPSRQKETYILIKQEGLNRKEAAMQLSVSPETVKWNLDQAMRSIRAYCVAQLGIEIGILILLRLL